MTTADLTPSDFSEFFGEIYGYDPFPWQVELTRNACAGVWPSFLAVPTGSGKTATLDAAIFALATQSRRAPAERTVGRRIFYVVNRRVIVDEAFERGQRIARALRMPRADQPTVARVAAALGSLSSGSTLPLECVQLRGGIYRDQQWSRSLSQPLIVASTVDQIGSRLLFRGYGVSASMRPIHAAMVAHDSIILLDEAHISRPFAQTLQAVATYRSYGAGESRRPGAPTAKKVTTPFAYLQMTATPPANTPERLIVRLTPDDWKKPTLRARLEVQKSTTLLVANARGPKALETLAIILVSEAVKLSEAYHPRSIAILVNRVATARMVEKILATRFSPRQVTLLIGRMRPLDRDDLTKNLRQELRTLQPGETRPESVGETPRFVVATQCLEVGADFDFDALVTECASIDSLRQRFGRLNRGGRSINARAVVAIRSDQVFSDEENLESDPKAGDPIYASSLARTWNWLQSVATNGVVDFGISTMDTFVQTLRASDETRFASLLSPTTDAPILLPAYLDAWCQTNPGVTPEPEPALFLHGPRHRDADVQVCWRADLPAYTDSADIWTDTLSLCVPTTVECLNVPMIQFRQWFMEEVVTDTGDILGALEPETSDSKILTHKQALIWRGSRESFWLKNPSDLRPGDTIVLHVGTGGWEVLGHLPGATAANVDLAERGFRQTKQREILRLRPELMTAPPPGSALKELLTWATNADRDWVPADIRELLRRASNEHSENKVLARTFSNLANPKYGLEWLAYSDEQGVVLKSRLRVPALFSQAEDQLSVGVLSDDGDDYLSGLVIMSPVPLYKHLDDVLTATRQIISAVALEPWRAAFESAAILHDWGKADERFQALLLGGDTALAWAQIALFAKSAKMPDTAIAYEKSRRRAGLPKGFRHEMLSVQLVETAQSAALLPTDSILRTLALHLIASHHGYARPFAPVVVDDIPPAVDFVWEQKTIHVASIERAARPSHGIDSGIAERFWVLTRLFGWWGLVYMEAAFRLADQQASAIKEPAIQ